MTAKRFPNDDFKGQPDRKQLPTPADMNQHDTITYDPVDVPEDTIFSANPLDLGYSGVDALCAVSLSLMKALTSAGENCGPLSVISCMGIGHYLGVNCYTPPKCVSPSLASKTMPD
ncbi:hypothetical protein PoB_006394600 [Plakobranchus ocellatus]|uniref:Uncharacterized protein n=1 Tax=Plakobranchus ocellatus TaxID=259542 RepID=A0AAV4D0D2_9GAST|nr:hypothetical protein PoB_006394600 [Plakobranchus ocellatus]